MGLEEKIDQREFRRIQRKFIMRVAQDDGDPWPRWSLVTTHNVSAGGAMFTYDQTAKAGDKLQCKLHFLDREIDCRARVIRTAGGNQKPLVHLAVSFEWMNEKDRHYVADFSKREPQK